jgi:protein SCO1/2
MKVILRINAKKLVLVCAVMSLTIALTVQTALAQKKDHSRDIHPPPTASGAKPLPPPKLSIPDVEVVDQDGRKQNFYADLVKDKVVIINFVFTTCKVTCTLSGANFSKLQTLLGERLGRDVFLISVSTDPETDSPEKLKAWGERFKAKPGWTLITGASKEVAGLLRVLKGDGLDKDYHVPSLYMVNDVKKTHRRAFGLEDPARIIKMVDELATAVHDVK